MHCVLDHRSSRLGAYGPRLTGVDLWMRYMPDSLSLESLCSAAGDATARSPCFFLGPGVGPAVS